MVNKNPSISATTILGLLHDLSNQYGTITNSDIDLFEKHATSHDWSYISNLANKCSLWSAKKGDKRWNFEGMIESAEKKICDRVIWKIEKVKILEFKRLKKI